MKAVIQRVTGAELKVDGQTVSEIGKGLCVYLGVKSGDTTAHADYLAKKIASMRIFSDDNGKMNISALEKGYEILLISQFTLLADCSHGNRPDFILAEKGDRANELYLYTKQKLIEAGLSVKTGIFGADMKITQFNDGPVTIIMDTDTDNHFKI